VNDRLFLPYFISYTDFLLRASLALYYTIEYPNYFATSLAVVVLPNPASPLSNAALEFIVPDGINELNDDFTSRLLPLIWISYHIFNHSTRSRTCDACPIIYSYVYGLYFYVHGIFIPELFIFYANYYII